MHLFIIGNGVSGITAALSVRKLDPKCRITVISEETDFFYSRTALMYVFMGQMKAKHLKPYPDSFWSANHIELLRGRADHIDFEGKEFAFTPSKENGSVFPASETLRFDQLVIASGSVPRIFGWPGQNLEGVSSLYGFDDLKRMERHSSATSKIVVVGGGLTGIEMAEMFHSRGIHVTMLVRESGYFANVLPTEEAAMISRHIVGKGIDLRLNTQLQAICDDGNGRVSGVVTTDGEEIPCSFVGLTTGVRPNVDWLRGGQLEIGEGILVDACLQTNIPGVYAVGDCAELRNPPGGRRPIEAMWYVGRMMGQTVAHTICGEPTPYQPGIWFNSAKFLDILYQAYGSVPHEWDESLGTLFWQHRSGLQSLRIMYEAKGKRVTGFTTLGLALRQDTCTSWIQQGVTLEEVLKQLPAADFGQELSRQVTPDILSEYRRLSGKKLEALAKRGPRKAFR